MAITEIVYPGHDNPAVVTYASTDSPTPLAGVTRITCELRQAGVTVDSDADAAAITWTDTQVTFDLGDYAATGTQESKVTAYDSGHPDGQVISHPGGPDSGQVNFKFVQ